eukprot:6751664-Prymnesium_polylepis.2
MIESNCRLHGAEGSWMPIVERCLGYSHVSALLDAHEPRPEVRGAAAVQVLCKCCASAVHVLCTCCARGGTCRRGCASACRGRGCGAVRRR